MTAVLKLQALEMQSDTPMWSSASVFGYCH